MPSARTRPQVKIPEMRSAGACHCLLHTEAIRQLFPNFEWPDEGPKFDNLTPEQRRNVNQAPA